MGIVTLLALGTFVILKKLKTAFPYPYQHLQNFLAYSPRILAVFFTVYEIYSTAISIAIEKNSNKISTEYAILVLLALMGLAVIFLRAPTRWGVFFFIGFIAGGIQNGLEVIPTPLMAAVMHDDIQKVNIALSRGVNIREKNIALLTALQGNYIDVARLLLKQGADIRQFDRWREPLLYRLIESTPI